MTVSMQERYSRQVKYEDREFREINQVPHPRDSSQIP
jgi:hypothetical protein